MDKSTSITKETDTQIITIHTQLLDEPDEIVVLITKKVVDKTNGKSTTETLYRNGVDITPAIISDLIKDHKTAHDRMVEQYNRYTGDDLPIDARTFDDTTKINRKLANDFRGEIVDQLVGFLFGKPITYTLDEKITIKGRLAKFGLALPAMDMEDALRLYPRCYGTSVSNYPKHYDHITKRWRKRNASDKF